MGNYENATNWKRKGLINDKRLDKVEKNIDVNGENIKIDKSLKINNGEGIILSSPNGSEFKLTINNDGTINILTLSITEAIGGDSSTETFNIILEGGNSSTETFEEILDGGSSL